MGVPRTLAAAGPLERVTHDRWIDVGPAEPSEDGEILHLRVRDADVSLARVGSAWLAFDDECTHHGCPLHDGVLEGATIECECHGSIFDLRTGAVLRGPATEPIRIHAAEIRDGRVVVRSDER
jgi:3-phenylpropionate/trans-cinnamate dioxygenase ferredoxin component